MPALPTLFADLQQGDLPLHEQLVRALRTAILAGQLPQHSRLPASRALARDLALSRSTVELAYARLEAEGYLVRKVGAGSFVAIAPRQTPPRAAPLRAARALSRRGEAMQASGSCREEVNPGPNFGAGQADALAFPGELWGKLLQQRWRREGERLMRYGDPQGLPALREAIAGYLMQSRGVNCDPEQILILTSSQQGIQLAAQLLTDPGDCVWLEEPGYPGARSAMVSAGAKVHPVPVDEEGLNPVGSLPAPRLIYCTPSHQYPLGMAMSLQRRMTLLAEAARHNAWIIEDDYDGEFQYDQRPLPALQGLDSQGRVLYVGTFSKVLFGSLRLAYLVLPHALMTPFCQARAAVDGHSNQLLQGVTADFIQGGHFAAHLRQMRPLYRSRRDLLVETLASQCPTLTPIHTGAGLQLCALLPPGEEARWTAPANRQGLGLRPLSDFYLTPPDAAPPCSRHEGWLLGYGALDNASLRQLCRALGRLMAQAPDDRAQPGGAVGAVS
ncbi:MocR-like pyridoxine biosynthesis transcription factor PdxR [Aeromonas bivalvium]|uniref:MocR-like pyridoxine biosynthesis transcription factor PdxR n=1 Tax=Aeromonas bivalvium TaxID=440079 RepID=UPI0005AB5CBB|nr:PLP-dependent aminotransferase family protein [Aeromonas bivalvium]